MTTRKYRKLYDENIEESYFLSKICANTYSTYYKSKKVMIVASRDFVVTQFVHQVSPPFNISLASQWKLLLHSLLRRQLPKLETRKR